MTVIARGSAQVSQLERALGGRPPSAAVQRSRRELKRYVTERSKAQQQVRADMARLAKPFYELAFEHIPKDDPRLTRHLEATRDAYERRSKHKRKARKAEKFEASISTGSIQAIKVPPYDTEWTSAPAGTSASADHAAGTYDMAAQSIGDGSHDAAAGVAVWFFAPADDPQQRFAALLDYSDDWWDSASGYVAHNDLRTRLWVWDDADQTWAIQSDVSPQWSDGVGWFESHGNDPQGDSGRISVETFFPARGGSWYLAWVWSDASVYADGGFWGIAASSIQFAATVPLVVFGSL